MNHAIQIIPNLLFVGTAVIKVHPESSLPALHKQTLH